MSEVETEDVFGAPLDVTPGEAEAAKANALIDLRAAHQAFVGALVACNKVGVDPADSLKYVGIEVPAMLAPMLAEALSGLAADIEADA